MRESKNYSVISPMTLNGKETKTYRKPFM